MKAYIVITPVRNEERFLQRTIDSMTAQTIPPLRWIIVDDGSADNTAKIALAASQAHSWIAVVQQPDRGFRKPGGGVIEAFYRGYRLIEDSEKWHFIVKLDGDLSFAGDFFEKCLSYFEEEPKLGIGGGTICKQAGHTLTAEAPGDPVFHVRGATKIYKRECWEAIGGLIQAPGWDTVDEYKANMLGWLTYTFSDLKLCHHRPAGGAQGTWKNWVKNGLANYVAGYHPLFMLFKCARRVTSRPRGVGSLGLLAGFLSGYVKKVPQVSDKPLIKYVREQQMRRLLNRESLWNRKAPRSKAELT